MTVSIGADPEFFLYDPRARQIDAVIDGEEPERDEDGEYIEPEPPGYVPCVGLIPGTKENPHQLDGPPGYFCHEDNVSLEVGFPPSSNPRHFVDHIMHVKRMVQEQFLDTLGYDLAVIPSITFRSDQLTSTQARTAGCEPDYDAYTSGKARTIQSQLMLENVRYAGGHIHLGGDFNCPPFVVALFADIFLSLRFIGSSNNSNETLSKPRGASFYCPDWRKRAEWYGKPGIFRIKPYGIEYRTPSNWWCRSNRPARAIANSAISLCTFLENNNATKLREIVRNIDWLAVQNFLSDPPMNLKERTNKQEMLYSECLEHIDRIQV